MNDERGGQQWQLIGAPLYVSVKRAAALSGISAATLYEWAHDARDPIPHIMSGRKILIRTAALPEYLRRKETA